MSEIIFNKFIHFLQHETNLQITGIFQHEDAFAEAYILFLNTRAVNYIFNI